MEGRNPTRGRDGFGRFRPFAAGAVRFAGERNT